MPRLYGLVALLSLAGLLLPAAGNPTELLTVATVAVVLLLAWRPPDRSAPRIRVRVRVLRDCAHRSAFMRSRDPDADGRTRPRAPGLCPAAA
ncbi:MAG TPA: DUF6412 domain-containing protein [Actinophytocola sp.]|uniref:DUF6412 domain-containing protein n=1 Tax=Actinophytocola sp. TaxID=1872138 RepID=UPI002DDD0C10|nr:DUF6412 domain-containing protein [Actinophytocola sp.]HEV2779420.1 DUF6412 domain-containing protein [Actinophytocola sp.]